VLHLQQASESDLCGRRIGFREPSIAGLIGAWFWLSKKVDIFVLKGDNERFIFQHSQMLVAAGGFPNALSPSASGNSTPTKIYRIDCLIVQLLGNRILIQRSTLKGEMP
jgi:hypothetical protein